MTLHMVLGSFVAVGFGVGGIHAWRLRQGGQGGPGGPQRFHHAALELSLAIAIPAVLLQLISGDILARHVAIHQPVKFAALESQFATEAGAPIRLGGLPDPERRVVVGAVEVPRLLSLLAYHDPNETIQGLSAFPRDQWPPLVPVRIAWELMLASGSALALAALAGLWRLWRWPKTWLDARWFLAVLAACAPLGFIALESGWVVTEVGRQPWIIYGVMRTADAVTPMPRLVIPFLAFTVLYLLLSIVVAVLMRRIVLRAETERRTGEWSAVPMAR
jgi:cytochrome d ubiquinol oxidase subunit I